MKENAPFIVNTITHAAGPDWSETVLQTLNRRVGTDQLLLVKELFDETVNSWEGIPVIFCEDGIHPDFDLVDVDLNEAALAVDGRVVGSIKNPHIETDGHPRLMATLDVSDDRVEELFKAGELGLSTAFKAGHDGDRITTPPIPNHVLLFREQVDLVQQGDPGAIVHTMPAPITKSAQSVSNNQTEKLPNKEFDMADPTEPTPQTPADTPTDVSAELEQKNEEIESLKAQLAAANELADGLKAELDAVKQELETYKTAEADRKFSELLEQLPEGMTRTDELKHSLRKEFELDPIRAATKLMKARQLGGETAPIGDTFVHTNEPVERQIGNLSPHALKLNQK